MSESTPGSSKVTASSLGASINFSSRDSRDFWPAQLLYRQFLPGALFFCRIDDLRELLDLIAQELLLPFIGQRQPVNWLCPKITIS